MISFDTDSLRPHERFDHCCEVRAKGLFGVTIEVPRERRPDFYGRFSAFARLVKPTGADAAVRHVAQLAPLARGRVTRGTTESRGTLRHG